MELTTEGRLTAFMHNCTHRINKSTALLVRKADFGYEFGQVLNGTVSTWYGTRDINLSELVPINCLGGDYDHDDIGYQVKLCPTPVLEAMATELHSYGATRQAPVTQQHADCWGVTLDQVWEWVMPAYGAAVRQGYKPSSKVGV